MEKKPLNNERVVIGLLRQKKSPFQLSPKGGAIQQKIYL